MAQRLIKLTEGVRAQIFHDDGKGLRGITFMRCSGPRGDSLYVSVLDENGSRKARTSYSLKGADFPSKWFKACESIAEYYGVSTDAPLFGEMIMASPVFLDRYGLALKKIVTVTYQAGFAA